ncbi:inorganic diphosphatase, partial [Candidatus Uhrbacteria bacterium]|nr:inorganic diphosphatase [Candidatus Uhrbacteria bacterium]
MKVFIENEAGSNQKNLYNEKTLEYRKTVEVSRKYPYPYGFILETTSGDGDNLDCFILTKQKLKTGSIVECVPIGLMEQFEDGKEDHNVLATLKDESAEVNPEVKEKLTEFVSHVFDHRKGKVITVGNFYYKDEAEDCFVQPWVRLHACKDYYDMAEILEKY